MTPIDYSGREPWCAHLKDAVLVPVFNQKKNDETALGILRELFPNREVIGIDCRDIVWEGGAIHCISQQQPSII